jgi:hypothetical protein
MAKVYIERAYIEPYDEEEDHQILFHVKQGNEHVFAGKVDIDAPLPWIHLETSKNGDLLINNSAGMEENKWDHITREIVREI